MPELQASISLSKTLQAAEANQNIMMMALYHVCTPQQQDLETGMHNRAFNHLASPSPAPRWIKDHKFHDSTICTQLHMYVGVWIGYIEAGSEEFLKRGTARTRTSAAEIKPLPSLSNTLNASRNSSSLSWSCRTRIAQLVLDVYGTIGDVKLIGSKQQVSLPASFAASG